MILVMVLRHPAAANSAYPSYSSLFACSVSLLNNLKNNLTKCLMRSKAKGPISLAKSSTMLYSEFTIF